MPARAAYTPAQARRSPLLKLLNQAVVIKRVNLNTQTISEITQQVIKQLVRNGSIKEEESRGARSRSIDGQQGDRRNQEE